jgi:L-glutamine:2-deoxy-scyllo-inosose/3-amino-2,3-dideoxy-scyllo-inosose aminotransferase
MEFLMSSIANETLAILGGTPVATDLAPLAWPPTLEVTERHLIEVFRSRKWSFNGPKEQAFNQAFADYHGAAHGVFMANGTVTLQCALQALGVGAGDEVILPALTWPATAMAVLYVGATPVFVDVEADTLCLDPTLIEAAITSQTKAIIPVHLYGSIADLDAILAIAEKHKLYVIEDCAHAHGGKWRGKGVGSWGHIGSFSFQESKTMSSGEGGICLTSDVEIADRLYRLKHIGYPPASAQGKAGTGPEAGLVCHNFRGTEFQAVILHDQLNVLPELMDRFAANAALLAERLQGLPGVQLQARGKQADVQGYYGLGITFTEGPLTRLPIGRIVEALAAEGWAPNTTYGPVYQHILWNASPEEYRLPAGGCPVADGPATSHTLILMHFWLSAETETIEKIAAIIRKVALNAEALENAVAVKANADAETAGAINE